MNFFDLNRIKALAPGQRTALKRCAGKQITDADAYALQAFFKALPGVVGKEKQEIYFAVMCLSCLWKSDANVRVLPFAKCLQKIRSSDSFDNRVYSLIDTPWSDDGLLITKMFRLTKMIHSDGRFMPDFENMLKDILNWNDTDGTVQIKWMEQYVLTDNEEKIN